MVKVSAAASLAAVRAFLLEVGVGGTFTMLQLREAVPGANQVDRRMRELRQAIPPWTIRSSQNDSSLPPDHYRVEVIGGEKLASKPSARVRREVFEKAGNRCEVCGIGLGEEFAEYPGTTARLQLGHWVPLDQGGSPTKASNLRSECHLCNGAIRHLGSTAPTAASVEARLLALRRVARADFLRWVEQGRRDVDAAETLFYELRQLPAESRELVLLRLRETLKGIR